jgi:thioredoxin-related protein
MEEGPFSNKQIADYTEEYFIPAKIKTTNNETFNTPYGKMTTSQLAGSLRLRGVPAVYFFDSEGKPVFSVPGYVPEDIYQVILRYVAEEHYKNKSFQDFQESVDEKS